MMLPDNVKDAEIRFRIPAWLKADFLRHCQMRDVPASHLLRRFIRAAVSDQGPSSLADDVRRNPATAYDCPRCGCSEVVTTDGPYFCPACRLTWQYVPPEVAQVYADRIVKPLGGQP